MSNLMNPDCHLVICKNGCADKREWSYHEEYEGHGAPVRVRLKGKPDVYRPASSQGLRSDNMFDLDDTRKHLFSVEN